MNILQSTQCDQRYNLRCTIASPTDIQFSVYPTSVADPDITVRILPDGVFHCVSLNTSISPDQTEDLANLNQRITQALNDGRALDTLMTNILDLAGSLWRHPSSSAMTHETLTERITETIADEFNLTRVDA